MKPLVVHRRIAIEELEWFKTKPWHLTDQLTLKQFLEQESTKAGVFDSHGEFSVSLEDAMDKMLKHRYPEPECFVLRLLQSAAVVGAKEALVIVGRDLDYLVSFTVDEPGRYASLPVILEGLTRSAHSRCAEGYLLEGIQAAMSLSGSGFEWSQLRGERKDILSWTAESSEVSRTFKAHAPPNETKFRLLGFRQRIRKTHFFARVFDFLSNSWLLEIGNLRPRLAAFPVNLRLYQTGNPYDGLIQNIDLSHLKEEPNLANAPSDLLTLVKLGPKKVIDIGILVARVTENQIVIDEAGEPVQSGSLQSRFRASCVIRWMPRMDMCRLHWVEAGVILETETLKVDGFGHEAWVSVHGLKTDLSGFKVVRNDQYHERVKEVKQLVEAHLAGPVKEWLTSADTGYRDSDFL